jgi:acetylornithine deacetylase/succinyl-diaminopimelate desuccinylase-like protein
VAPENARRVHGIDERVRVETLVESIELNVEIIRALDAIDVIDAPGSAN